MGKAIAAVELRAELADKSGGSAQDLEAKVAEWRAKLQTDANDHQARYDLAHVLFSTGQTEEALDQILDLIKRFLLLFLCQISRVCRESCVSCRVCCSRWLYLKQQGQALE